jgi:hypothetical protein
MARDTHGSSGASGLPFLASNAGPFSWCRVVILPAPSSLVVHPCSIRLIGRTSPGGAKVRRRRRETNTGVLPDLLVLA